ncbi:transmembrane protein 208-like [Xenia sp. Carnegie-2017]|uniref:transmembrane protein 208-like n=1 Tax=Xenia sp. Carnegie-2017 TaxID=2897299 RepID=UPI001F04625A|nr:transmembrane protein 208-like [Xenia sp. Carnegie-2017]
MAATKGKQPTKGRKEILQGNKETLAFYIKIMAAATFAHIGVCFLLFFSTAGWFALLSLVFSSSVYIACYKTMRSMAKPTYSSTGALLDGGIDLNMTSGMAEHLKDLILLTAIVQILGLLSHYFWLLWLLAPGRAFYMLWTNILAPWIFAEPLDQEVVDPKQQKKLDRKMKKEKIIYR